MSTIAERSDTHDFSSEIHVYEPHKVGLPPLRKYLDQLWRRREFAFELARSDLMSKHYNTALGQLWLILNPLFLGLVYFALVQIIGRRGGTVVGLAYLLLALFTFRLVSSSVSQGARSVVGGGRLILNSAFPRTLLPLSSVLTSFMLFLPTIVVYAIVHVIAGLPITAHILWGIPIIAMLVVFAAGMAMLVAAVQVYFRDLTSFLRYMLRIWLYASPVLWVTAQVPEKYQSLLYINPLYPPLTALSQSVDLGRMPDTHLLLLTLAWAVGALVVGGLFFISREREFAVRL
jgi:ABC-type polysaccharide/polyol phosphate export permease